MVLTPTYYSFIMEVGDGEFSQKTSHGTKEQNDCIYGMIDLGALEKKPVEVSTYGDDRRQ